MLTLAIRIPKVVKQARCAANIFSSWKKSCWAYDDHLNCIRVEEEEEEEEEKEEEDDDDEEEKEEDDKEEGEEGDRKEEGRKEAKGSER